MPIPAKVKAYLKKAKVGFEEIGHKTVFTAYDVAQTLKRNLKEIGKTLLVKTDKAYVLVVVPASHRLDLAKLKKALKVKKVEMVPEKVMAKMLKVKAGALTAFGKLHKLPLIVDRSLLKTKEVILQAGSFTDSVRMKAKDFVEMEEALLAGIVEATGIKVGKSKGKKKAK